MTSSYPFYYKKPIKPGFIHSIKMKVYVDCTNVIHLYDENKSHIKKIELKNLTSGINIIPLNINIAENTYVAFECENICVSNQSTGGFMWGRTGFDDSDVEIDIAIGFLYENNYIKNTHIFDYDKEDKLIIDTKARTVSLIENTSFVYDNEYVLLQKDTINYTCDENDNQISHFRSIFIDPNTKELYVSLTPRHYTDLYLCGFNDKGSLVGNTDGVYVKHTKIIMIGDSYAEGYNPDGSVNIRSWCDYLKAFMGLSNDETIVNYLGGTGFANAVNNKTFKTLLEEVAPNVTNTSMVEKSLCVVVIMILINNHLN